MKIWLVGIKLMVTNFEGLKGKKERKDFKESKEP